MGGVGSGGAHTVVSLCHSNAECCEIDFSQQGQKLRNMEAEGSAALEAVTRQPAKTQQAKKT
jgi:hypothetical protein